MSEEKSITIFGGTATLVIGLPLVTGHLTMSIVGKGGAAWSQVFTYDPASKIMETDHEKLSQAVLTYGNGIGPALNGLMVVSDLIVKLVNWLVSAIQGIVGSFIGIGMMGILFVMILAIISLFIGIEALLYTAPLLLLSYGLRSLKNGRLRKAKSQVGKEAMDLFREAANSVAAPALAPQT